MRILLISDIHSNLSAFEAALDAALPVDEVWCLGDIIGYGPCPNECVARVKDLASTSLVGNHDLACLGQVDLSDFNPLARFASEWTFQQLTEESRAFLTALHPYHKINDRVTVAHGSPREPIWEYLLEPQIADNSLDFFDTQICFVGHTHVPTVFRSIDGRPCTRSVPSADESLTLEPDSRYIINPGSIGQPRDGDPRAAYAIFDTDSATIHFHRVAYNIAKTQQIMQEAGLPELLIARLSFGM